jgi:hypothetical protein
MIYHRDKLDTTPDMIESAVVTLYKSIWPHDVFVVSTSEIHVERMKRMESVAKCQYSKPSWIKAINKNEGVIFTITSGMFRRKHDRHIMTAIERVKNQHDGLTSDVIENQKFAVYFFGLKNKKTKETEDIEPVEPLEPNNDDQ